MAALTIKNIPDDLYARLKQCAAEHRRSINSEMIFCLQETLASHRVDPDAFLADVRALRESITGIYLKDEDLGVAIDEGRS